LKVILDTDFLSSFLKIERIDLIRQFHRVEFIYISPKVYQEISESELLPLLTNKDWVMIEPPTHEGDERLLSDPEFMSLGTGERESILLALKSEGAILLINDNKARKVAIKRGITAFSIPDFLMACKARDLLTREEIGKVIIELKEKDFYEFKEEVKKLLLA
jgi:predicted nucleic acid-binding protein